LRLGPLSAGEASSSARISSAPASAVAAWARFAAESRADSGGWNPHPVVEGLAILADGHGESRQFLEGLVRLAKAHGDGSRAEFHAVRQSVEIVRFDPPSQGLGDIDPHGGLPDPLLAGLRETFGESIPAAFFIIGFLSGGDSFQMAHKIGAAGHHAGSDTANRDGREKLLGAAAADAQERLESGAVDPRLGAVFELAEGFG